MKQSGTNAANSSDLGSPKPKVNVTKQKELCSRLSALQQVRGMQVKPHIGKSPSEGQGGVFFTNASKRILLQKVKERILK